MLTVATPIYQQVPVISVIEARISRPVFLSSVTRVSEALQRQEAAPRAMATLCASCLIQMVRPLEVISLRNNADATYVKR